MVCGAGMHLHAQVLKPGVGLNFTDISTDDGEAKAKAGWQIGGSIAFGENFYIEPGIFYVGKSSKFTPTDDVTADDIEAQFKGIRIPVALGLTVLGSETTTASLRAFGGGSAFVLTSVGDAQIKDDFKKTTFGVFAGAGVDISIFFIDLAYEWSVSDLSDVESVDIGKTRGLYATAGLRLRL